MLILCVGGNPCSSATVFASVVMLFMVFMSATTSSALFKCYSIPGVGVSTLWATCGAMLGEFSPRGCIYLAT